MAGARLLDRQRQMYEIGRLRAGYVDGRRPVKAKTWLVTSRSEEAVKVAAEAFGGTAEPWQPQGNGAPQWRCITTRPALPVFLPPGDTLSQHYELWSGGGCKLRCDGQTELLGNQPCVCKARFGEDFYTQPAGRVCKPTTRLSVIIPGLPLGLWRVETHGHYAANEVAGMVDFVKGIVADPTVMVPMQLRIDQRTVVRDGQTKQFTVVVVEPPAGQSAQAILSGQVDTVRVAVGGGQRAAIGAGPTGEERPAIGGAPEPTAPARDWAAEIEAARSPRQLDTLAEELKTAGAGTAELVAAWRAKKASFAPAPEEPTQEPARPAARREPEPPEEPAAETVEAEAEPDRRAVWQQIMEAAGGKGWTLAEVRKRFQTYIGHDHRAPSADGWAYVRFLSAVQSGEIQ